VETFDSAPLILLTFAHGAFLVDAPRLCAARKLLLCDSSFTSTPSRTACQALPAGFSNLLNRPWAFRPDRRRADRLPHLGENLVGGNAAIHHPDALCLAILGFDLCRKARSVVQSAVFPGSTS